MISLIIKDFAIQKKNLKNYIAIGLFLGLIFTFNGSDQMSFAMPTFLIIFGFIGKASYEDEANHTVRWIAALPIKKTTIVQARYLSVALASAFTVLVFQLIKNSLILLNVITIEAGAESYLSFLLVILIFVVMIAIYIPMIYKMGYIKAANIYKFLIFGFIGLGLLSVKVLIPSGPPPAAFLNLTQWISEMSQINLTISVAVISLLIYIISMSVSMGIYSRKHYF